MRIFQLITFIFISAVPEGLGQKSISLFEKLYGLEQVNVSLTYPFDSLYRTNQEEIAALITIECETGVLLKDEPIKLNLRGKFRRMKCSMPPLLLNFRKSTLRSMELNDIDEIKLVTHCLDTPEGQQNLEEERLCYQVYETLTTYAYRTIWLTVNYHDAQDPNRYISSTGFLLEPDKDISNRLGVHEYKLFNVVEDSLSFETYSLASAFNFLIGNMDWSIIMSRNAKLFYNPANSRYEVIPYDFDYSNVVGATYRRESRPAKMSHPYDRVYQGEYYKGRAAEILKDFQGYEDLIINRVNTAPNPMDKGKREKIKKYFETWFTQVRKSADKDIDYGMIIYYKGGL